MVSLRVCLSMIDDSYDERPFRQGLPLSARKRERCTAITRHDTSYNMEVSRGYLGKLSREKVEGLCTIFIRDRHIAIVPMNRQKLTTSE